MAVTLNATKRGLIVAAALILGVPMASYAAGYFVNYELSADSVTSSAGASPLDFDQLAALPPDVRTNSLLETVVEVPEMAVSDAPPEPVRQEVSVASGDNLMSILVRAGVNPSQAHAAIASLKNIYNPRRDLNVGDKLLLTLWPASTAASEPEAPSADPSAAAENANAEETGLDLDGLLLPVSYNRDVAIKRDVDGGFNALEIERPLETVAMRAGGTISSSLFVDGRDAGLPIGVLIELIRIYSYDVDFQREIQPGDGFEVMYDQFRDEEGKPVHNGEISYAKLTLSGSELPLYRYETTTGNLDWFNAKGESVRKALMRTPIDGARLSSGFGMRKHPVLGYTKLHTGTDFAAPTGTPIYAAGNGTIDEIGRKGGYGNYIRIRHNGTYDTAYAHMKAFARGMNRGKRVNQGQVIGYVGTTGRSTGPHLHYEVHRDGKKINPLALKLPTGEKLKGKELDRFAALRDEADRKFATLPMPATPETLLAGTESDSVSCGGGELSAQDAADGDMKQGC